jgi:endonuclease/exonuclease/phosphatase family metal-dependent hydrolase
MPEDRPVIVTTWNVLHHVHAVNWDERPVVLDEPARIEAIARRVKELLGSSLAVCLQEVSGDQLCALEAPHVLSFALPRVPRPRRGPTALTDPTEHLVVVSSLGPGTVVEQRAFATDPGKGFVAVQLEGGVVVVSTHVSYGERAAAQLEELATWVRAQVATPVVIGGDFNADRPFVMAALGPGFTSAPLPEQSRPSRPRSAAAGKSQHIDHVIGHLLVATEAAVEDGRGLSDHNPVWGRLA